MAATGTGSAERSRQKVLARHKRIKRLETAAFRNARGTGLRLRQAILAVLDGGTDWVAATGLATNEIESILLATIMAGHLAGARAAARAYAERFDPKRRAFATREIDKARRLLERITGSKPADVERMSLMYERHAKNQAAQLVTHVIDEVKKVDPSREAIRAKLSLLGVGHDKPHLMETAIRTQLHMGYSAGKLETNLDPLIQEELWGYEYVAILDDRIRANHAGLDGAKLPKEDPRWQTIMPPCGFNCRCDAVEIWYDDADATIVEPPSTIDVDGTPVVVQPDKGWAFAPGDITASTPGLAPEPVKAVVKPKAKKPAAKKPAVKKKPAAPAAAVDVPDGVTPMAGDSESVKYLISSIEQDRQALLSGKLPPERVAVIRGNIADKKADVATMRKKKAPKEIQKKPVSKEASKTQKLIEELEAAKELSKKKQAEAVAAKGDIKQLREEKKSLRLQKEDLERKRYTETASKGIKDVWDLPRTPAQSQQEWLASLNPKELKAVSFFTDGEYGQIRFQQAEDGPATKQRRAWINGLNSAYSRRPVTKPRVLRRGLNGLPPEDLAKFAKSGKTFSVDAWSSFSTDKEIAESFGQFSVGAENWIDLKVKTRHGMSIRDISQFKSEEEVMVPRGARFKIAKVTEKTNKWGVKGYVVEMEDDDGQVAKPD